MSDREKELEAALRDLRDAVSRKAEYLTGRQLDNFMSPRMAEALAKAEPLIGAYVSPDWAVLD